MASLADIPDELLSNSKNVEFANWLLDLPVAFHVKRDLVYIWQNFTDMKLGAPFIRLLELRSLK